MRSDSLKSFRARAAARSEIKLSTCLASTPLACCFRPFHSAALSDRKPRNRREPANWLRSRSFPEAALYSAASGNERDRSQFAGSLRFLGFLSESAAEWKGRKQQASGVDAKQVDSLISDRAAARARKDFKA